MASELYCREAGLEQPLKQVFPTMPHHITQFELQDEQKPYRDAGIHLFATVKPSVLRGFARTLMIDWEPIAIIGVAPEGNGISWGWAYISNRALKHRMFLTRETRRCIEQARRGLQLKKMKVSVDLNHAAAGEWAEVLGFHKEKLMKSYGPNGEDCYLYVKVWDELV